MTNEQEKEEKYVRDVIEWNQSVLKFFSSLFFSIVAECCEVLEDLRPDAHQIRWKIREKRDES